MVLFPSFNDKSIKIHYLTITKEQAQFWLTKNTNNRNLRKGKLDSYVKQMNNGQWLESADPIRFVGNYERLIDGQHRLTAFIQSNLTSLNVLVVTNLQSDVFKVLDTGGTRSAGDILKIEGYASGGKMAAAIKAIINLEKNLVAFATNGAIMSKSGKESISNQDISNFVANNPDMPEIVRLAEVWYDKFKGLGPSEYAAFYYHFKKKDAQAAYNFFEQLSSGLNLTATSPIYVCRKKFEQDKMSGVRLVGKMRQHIIIYCWNAVRQGKEIKNLVIKYDSDLPKIL